MMYDMEIEAVLERIKKAKSLKSEREIASLLGLSPQDFSNRKKRGTLRPLIIQWAAREGININWLICEEGGMYHRMKDTPASGGLDQELLRRVISMVEEGIEELGVTPRPEKKADLIITLYEMQKNGKEIDRPTLLRLIGLAA